MADRGFFDPGRRRRSARSGTTCTPLGACTSGRKRGETELQPNSDFGPSEERTTCMLAEMADGPHQLVGLTSDGHVIVAWSGDELDLDIVDPQECAGSSGYLQLAGRLLLDDDRDPDPLLDLASAIVLAAEP